ncbi:MAG: hypothetical protein ACYDAM_06930 [Leptospirales bacterium]
MDTKEVRFPGENDGASGTDGYRKGVQVCVRPRKGATDGRHTIRQDNRKNDS